MKYIKRLFCRFRGHDYVAFALRRAAQWPNIDWNERWTCGRCGGVR
jgi:hypothetical protein